MSEMAPERPPLCAVCSSPLSIQAGRGRPRKVCRDEDSPTPGGCARWRNIELTNASIAERPNSNQRSRRRANPYRAFPGGGFIIETRGYNVE